MSQICRVLTWMSAFVIACAFAQIISLLPWSILIVGVAAVITYILGKSDNSMLLQVIAIGLSLGWCKCYFLG